LSQGVLLPQVAKLGNELPVLCSIDGLGHGRNRGEGPCKLCASTGYTKIV
jgi:hypothetical protein